MSDVRDWDSFRLIDIKKFSSESEIRNGIESLKKWVLSNVEPDAPESSNTTYYSYPIFSARDILKIPSGRLDKFFGDFQDISIVNFSLRNKEHGIEGLRNILEEWKQSCKTGIMNKHLSIIGRLKSGFQLAVAQTVYISARTAINLSMVPNIFVTNYWNDFGENPEIDPDENTVLERLVDGFSSSPRIDVMVLEQSDYEEFVKSGCVENMERFTFYSPSQVTAFVQGKKSGESMVSLKNIAGLLEKHALMQPDVKEAFDRGRESRGENEVFLFRNDTHFLALQNQYLASFKSEESEFTPEMN